MSHSLLIDEPPLQVQPSLAMTLGLNEAIFLQQVHYWLNPRFNKNLKDNKHWVHNTLQQWRAQFPFWGEKTIRRVISNLENLQILISNVKTNGFKKTKFYTIDYDALEKAKVSKPAETLRADACGQNDQIDLPKRADGVPKTADACGQYDQMEVVNMTRSYKDTETTTETSLSSGSSLVSEQSDFSSKNLEREGLDFRGKTRNQSISPKTISSQTASIKMVSIWNEVVSSKAISGANSFLAKQLEKALSAQLEGKLENWRTVCEHFASSKFLMGEAEGIRVKPDLTWLLDDSKQPRVRYCFDKANWTFGDRVHTTPPLNSERIEQSIATLDESPIARQVRLFMFQNHPEFYQSYVAPAALEVKGCTLALTALTRFAKEKIETEFQELLESFVKQKYNLSLAVTV